MLARFALLATLVLLAAAAPVTYNACCIACAARATCLSWRAGSRRSFMPALSVLYLLQAVPTCQHGPSVEQP